MEQCKNAEKNEIFVQDVSCAPEPMAVLCTEQQLNDIERFCCDPFNFCILGIDPTFNQYTQYSCKTWAVHMTTMRYAITSTCKHSYMCTSHNKENIVRIVNPYKVKSTVTPPSTQT